MMRSRLSLRQWCSILLPVQTSCARAAACALMRALLCEFTVNLTQLARVLDRESTAKIARQFLNRWLNHPAWDAEAIYTNLAKLSGPLLRQGKTVPLLIDATFLEKEWTVLQVSIPFRNRALPLFRAVDHYKNPECGLDNLLAQALSWLQDNLPGPRERYVLVLDRGFPSHVRVNLWQKRGWRFVMRVKGTWLMQHPEYAGPIGQLPIPRAEPKLFQAASLGRDSGGIQKRTGSTANVVVYQPYEEDEPWFLLTTEAEARFAVQIYRQRAAIECEFRDVKGPFGLDGLATWTSHERVERLLAWVAVYEWRLAYLWERHELETFGKRMAVRGEISWIRTVREWIGRKLRTSSKPATVWL